ncbi:MAG: hypothetical protein K5778_10850 [Bacteroidaceae bacterium]|nr:hypothetical protein [Bacteroidaceae bacterium]MDO4995047.1 hypothetical protein [Bacteroidales bacterium]
MNKRIRNILTLCATSLIATLGFTSCSSQKAAQDRADQKYQEILNKLTKEDDQKREEAASKAAEQNQLMKEAERRRMELERQKLVYGPPTTDFRRNIDR